MNVDPHHQNDFIYILLAVGQNQISSKLWIRQKCCLTINMIGFHNFFAPMGLHEILLLYVHTFDSQMLVFTSTTRGNLLMCNNNKCVKQ